MLTIRLQRAGSKNRPSFRIVLAEAERAAGKKFNEVLGHYNPRNKELGIKDKERLNYWIKQNVLISPTVHNLFVEKKLVEAKKVKAWAAKKKETAEAPAAEAKPVAEAKAEAPTNEAPAESAPQAAEPAAEQPQA